MSFSNLLDAESTLTQSLSDLHHAGEIAQAMKSSLQYRNRSPSQVSNTPSGESLLDEKSDAPLNASQAKTFLSIVMRLMYIAKSRPDIQYAVTHLTTRTQKPVVGDWHKLLKVGKYLNAIKDLPFRIEGSDLALTGSAAAVYSVHSGMRSQTGGLIWLGGRRRIECRALTW